MGLAAGDSNRNVKPNRHQFFVAMLPGALVLTFVVIFRVVQGGLFCASGTFLSHLWKSPRCAGTGRNIQNGGGISAGSPCPSVFRYEWDGVEWYGVITAPSVPYGTPAHLIVRLTIGRALPTKYAGNLELMGLRADILNALLNERPIQYKVNFPLPNPLPTVTSITLNDRLICSGTSFSAPIFTSIVLEHTLYPHGQPLNSGLSATDNRYKPTDKAIDTENISPLPPQPIPVVIPFPVREQNTQSTVPAATMNAIEKGYYQEVCGRPVAVQALIANGEVTKRGRYPWLAAIFKQKSLGIEFTCGGTLINSKFVITAAHCIRYREDRALTPEEILVFLGKYEIRRFTEKGVVSRDVKNIILHPEYQALSGDADLACLELTESVEFTDIIRPICTLPFGRQNEDITGQEGTIVGWGRDESGNKITAQPQQTKVRIVSQEDCLRSRLEFRFITSNRTFCAEGITRGSGPCSGDSGGGLFLRGKDGRWYLGGVISMSLADPETKSCDLEHYSVFVNIVKFSTWIAQFLR